MSPRHCVLMLMAATALAAEPDEPVAYLRRFIPSSDEVRLIESAIRELSDPAFSVRQRASQALQRFGPKAAQQLRRLPAIGDAESAHRARECLRLIDRDWPLATLQARLRRVAGEPPPDAGAVLLALLPHADAVAGDDIQNALDAVAALGGDRTAALSDALTHVDPSIRGAAAVALTRGQRRLWDATRKLLDDLDPAVRMKVALARMHGGERESVRVLIAALPVLSAERRAEADEALLRLAGDDAPDMEPGDMPAEVQKYHAAWQAWWQRHGPTADLDRLRGEGHRTDTFLVAVMAARGGPGNVTEMDFDGKIHRTFEGLSYPVAFEPLPRNRLLVAEFSGARVSERDVSGRVLWEKAVTQPLSCQRLTGGRVFVATRTGVYVYDRSGKELFGQAMDNVAGASRRRDGSMAVVLRAGTCQNLDANGAVVSVIATGRPLVTSSVQALPGGRVLIPEYSSNRVVEYDLAGKITWSAEVTRPNAAYRRPDGVTLVSSQIDALVTELDRNGRTLRSIRMTDGMRPFYVRPAGP